MNSKTAERLKVTIIAVLIWFYIATIIRSAWTIAVDAAEFENLQASWLVSQGFIPYSQFFDHHTPLFFYFISPFFPFLGPIQTDPRVAIQSISLIRAGMVILTVLIAACVYGIVWSWRDKKTAWISVILYLSLDMVVRKSIEIRPNLPATLLILSSFFLLLLSYRIVRNRQLTKFCSGFLFSMAVLMAEETLLFGIWLLLVLVTDVMIGNLNDKRDRIKENILVVIGFLVGMIGFLAYLQLHQTTSQFFQLLLHPDTYRASPTKKILQLVIQNPMHFAFVGFCLVAQWRSFRSWVNNRTERAIMIFSSGMLISLLITMEPHGQYFFFVLPSYAILAGTGSIKCINYFKELLQRQSHLTKLVIILTLHVVLLIALFWQIFLTGFPTSILTIILVVSGVICLTFGVLRLSLVRSSALDWIVISLLLIGFTRTQERLSRNDLAVQPSIQAISYIIGNSDPGDRILDGRSGTGLYRPIYWYYWVQHTQIGEEISVGEVDILVRSIRDGSLRPKYVYLDQYLHRYPMLVEYVEQNYRHVGLGDLWQSPE